MSDSTTGRAETLDDWLEQWDLHGGWRVSSEEARRLVEEIRALRIAIHGCGCPAPYDACTHDEPLTKTIERLQGQYDAMCDHASALLNERDDLRRELGW